MNAEKKKILIVEDDPFISRVCHDGLEAAGFDTSVVLDGGKAVEEVRSEKPDLILLDLMLPTKSGFEVLNELKADETLRHIPVIVLTNLDEPDDRKKCQELGALDYFVKANLFIEEMIQKVKTYVVAQKQA